jgi:LemA protein
VQLQRRYELIPNLVECAKGYMSHERETLEAVLKARAAAQSATAKVVANPANASAVSELSGAESVLSGAMGRLFALAEAYPDLKANTTMAQLMEELSSTENKVGFARQAFNDAVMGYNTAREQFPAVLVAGSFGFTPAELLQISDPAQRSAPKVSF